MTELCFHVLPVEGNDFHSEHLFQAFPGAGHIPRLHEAIGLRDGAHQTLRTFSNAAAYFANQHGAPSGRHQCSRDLRIGHHDISCDGAEQLRHLGCEFQGRLTRKLTLQCGDLVPIVRFTHQRTLPLREQIGRRCSIFRISLSGLIEHARAIEESRGLRRTEAHPTA
ncbi:hypothetical protein BHS04_32755 [Myxococcus xanthus]|nr:hypothetical protein BHS04_32755 [Myxococcus xanthus]